MRKNYFTLIELLIVAVILGILGGGVILALGGAQNQSTENILKAEENTIYQAIIRFKNDTGYYPKTGPFAYGNVEDEHSGTEDFSEAEFNNFQNFHQLFFKPVDKSDPDKWNWNIDSKRGWNGPYLNLNSYESLFQIPILGKDSPLTFSDGSEAYYQFDHDKNELKISIPSYISPTNSTYSKVIPLP